MQMQASAVSRTISCRHRNVYGTLNDGTSSLGVAYEPAHSCLLCASAIPAACLRLVARASAARVAADDLLLHRLQPDLMDQAPDPGGARRRIQWFFDCDFGRTAGWESGVGNRQTALYAPF